ncbi:lipid droplet-associated hydrolase-like [Sycon ciliatum]|uniref:lipid droplet-associated hydrolase-like n=1 Tax=Sycon ciliatum TaxID=27933 RepID=UPI0031F6DDF0
MTTPCAARVLSEIIAIGRVPSRVLHIRSQDVNGSGEKKPRPICYIIPGNPGASSFYRTFMQHLWEYSNGSMDLISVSHAGQDPGVLKSEVDCTASSLAPSDDLSCENDKVVSDSLLREQSTYLAPTNSSSSVAVDVEYFTVADQVDHHNNALHQLTEPNQPVILMGHSMGSYIITEMCRRYVNTEVRIVRALHLLPCPAWMGRSPNGQRLGPILTGFHSWICAAHHLVTFLPHCILRAAIRLHLSDVTQDIIDECVDIVMHSITGPNCRAMVANTAALGANEVNVMKEFDFETLRVMQTRSTFLCSPVDGWFPLHCIDELRAEIPELDVRIVDDIPHAFCLNKNAEVAKVAWNLVEHLVSS